MKTIGKLFVSSIVVMLFLASVAKAQPGADQKLPDVSLTTADGQKVSISTFASDDKITIFCFWATWCVPCKKELSNISQLYDQWKKDYNVEIIAVSIDDSRNIAKAKAYADGEGWTYQMLFDSNQQLKQFLNFQTVPFSIITDKAGNIVDKHSSYVEGDEYIMEDKLKELAGK